MTISVIFDPSIIFNSKNVKNFEKIFLNRSDTEPTYYSFPQLFREILDNKPAKLLNMDEAEDIAQEIEIKEGEENLPLYLLNFSIIKFSEKTKIKEYFPYSDNSIKLLIIWSYLGYSKKRKTLSKTLFDLSKGIKSFKVVTKDLKEGISYFPLSISLFEAIKHLKNKLFKEKGILCSYSKTTYILLTKVIENRTIKKWTDVSSKKINKLLGYRLRSKFKNKTDYKNLGTKLAIFVFDEAAGVLSTAKEFILIFIPWYIININSLEQKIQDYLEKDDCKTFDMLRGIAEKKNWNNYEDITYEIFKKAIDRVLKFGMVIENPNRKCFEIVKSFNS